MKIRVYVSTNMSGSESSRIIEISEEELEGLEGAERDQEIWDIAQETLWELIDWSWEEVK